MTTLGHRKEKDKIFKGGDIKKKRERKGEGKGRGLSSRGLATRLFLGRCWSTSADPSEIKEPGF